MRRMAMCCVLTACMVGCAPVLEAAVAPMPVAQPGLAAPPLPVGVAPPLPVTAPVVWREHAVERHGWDAVRAREAIRRGDPQCHHYLCRVDMLVLCPERDGYYAVQWRWADTASGQWVEGTSYITDLRGAERLVARKGCREIH